MTDLRAAAEMALERLTMWLEDFPDTAVIEDRWAVEALRQALAQGEQDHGFDRTASHMAGEYVDTAPPRKPDVRLEMSEFGAAMVFGSGDEEIRSERHLYPKQKWVSLTDEEIRNFYCPYKPTLIEYVRFIEAKLKELNT